MMATGTQADATSRNHAESSAGTPNRKSTRKPPGKAPPNGNRPDYSDYSRRFHTATATRQQQQKKKQVIQLKVARTVTRKGRAMKSIEARVAELEKDLADLRSSLGKTVQTNCVEIIDDSGTVRAKLQAGKDGTGLTVWEQGEGWRASLYVLKDVSMLKLGGKDTTRGLPGVELKVGSDGAELVFLDDQGKTVGKVP